MKQSVILPRIRLTKVKGTGRAIIPVAAISGIEEDKLEKCTRVCTFDGFWYEVSNSIEEVDAKIQEAEYGTSGKPLSDKSSFALAKSSEQFSQHKRLIKKTAAASGDKPPRRMADLARSEAMAERGRKCD